MLDEAVFDVNISLGDDWRAGLPLQFILSDETPGVFIGAKLGDIMLTAEQANQLIDALN